MTNDEKLTLAREALELAKNSHGVMLLTDPPQEAWKARGVYAAIRRALDAIATESAPAAGAASIITSEFNSLTLTHAKAVARGSSADVHNAWTLLIGHINYWGAQQREAGRQEGLQYAVQTISNSNDTAQEALKQRDQLRELLNLKENRITDLVAQLSALAQRAAGDDELPPLTMAVYGTREMLEQERQRRAQLAARAVGGVDVSSLKRYSPTYDESRGADGEDRWGVMEDAEEGEYVKLTDLRALLGAAPAAPITEAAPVVSAQAPVVAAPVGDGDERAKALEEAAKAVEQCYTGLGGPPDDPHPDAVLVNSTVNECAERVRSLIKRKE